MKYEYAKSVFDELKNFEGQATIPGSETHIDFFVLLPKADLEDFSLGSFLTYYKANTSFEIEGNHNVAYTLIGINILEMQYTNDVDYIAKLIIG